MNLATIPTDTTAYRIPPLDDEAAVRTVTLPSGTILTAAGYATHSTEWGEVLGLGDTPADAHAESVAVLARQGVQVVEDEAAASDRRYRDERHWAGHLQTLRATRTLAEVIWEGENRPGSRWWSVHDGVAYANGEDVKLHRARGLLRQRDERGRAAQRIARASGLGCSLALLAVIEGLEERVLELEAERRRRA